MREMVRRRKPRRFPPANARGAVHRSVRAITLQRLGRARSEVDRAQRERAGPALPPVRRTLLGLHSRRWNRPMRRAHALMAGVAALSATVLLRAGGPPDIGIGTQYNSVPLAMPYNGANGYAALAARQNAVSRINNDFNAAVRGDMIATAG